MTAVEPIINQEIPAVADRVARGLITYLLTEGRNFLGDAIGEALGDDQDAGRLDSYTRGKVYGLVWDQLGRAAAEYQPRDQVLTEAAELIVARRAEESAHERDHSDFADEHEMELETDAIDRAAGWLLTARATQES